MAEKDSTTGRFEKKPSGKKKKICCGCGEYLWLRDFYKLKKSKSHPDGYDCRCKECRRKEKREEYNRNRKIPDGIRMGSDGRRVEHKGSSTRLHWTDDQIKVFRRMFPVTKNEDLAIDFDCSLRTITRRAREMGLQKDEVWLHREWDKNRKLAQGINKICGTKNDRTNFIEGGKRYRYTSENHPSRTLSKEELSRRMKKAWQTRKSPLYRLQHGKEALKHGTD